MLKIIIFLISLIFLSPVNSNTRLKHLEPSDVENYGISISVDKEDILNFNRISIEIDENKSSCLQIRSVSLIDSNYKTISSVQLNSEQQSSQRKFNFIYNLTEAELEKTVVLFFYSFNYKVGHTKEQISWCYLNVDREIVLKFN